MDGMPPWKIIYRHVASPFIIEEPNHPDDLIRPAEEGTIRALTAAQKAKVNRVVVTSSIIAMMAHLTKGQFDPTHWTDLSSNNITSYARSKTMAEKNSLFLITNHLTIIKLNWLPSILGASWAQR